MFAPPYPGGGWARPCQMPKRSSTGRLSLLAQLDIGNVDDAGRLAPAER
jgi:hypothetical protein